MSLIKNVPLYKLLEVETTINDIRFAVQKLNSGVDTEFAKETLPLFLKKLKEQTDNICRDLTNYNG